MPDVFRHIEEKSTPQFKGIITDEDGVGLDISNIDTITLTFYDLLTGDIINGRNAQDIKGVAPTPQNNVTIDSSGNLIWYMQPNDTAIQDSERIVETHTALFQWSWSIPQGTRTGKSIVHFVIDNLEKVA